MLENREVSQDERSIARLTHVFQLSRLHAEIHSLRGDTQPSYRNTSNPLPPPPEPLPLDRFPPFARPGGAADTSDPLPIAVPYPPPPPRAPPTTSASTTDGYPSVASYGGIAHAQYVPPTQIAQPFAAPRARHTEAPRGDERSRRPSTQELNGINHHQGERRPHAEPNHASEARYAGTDGRSKKPVSGPVLAPRAVPAASPAPSWAHHPLVEERRSDDEREAWEIHRRSRTNGANSVITGGSDTNLRPSVGARLASAEAYIQGYGSGFDSGFQIANEPRSFASPSYGSDRSDRGFPVQESPDQPIGGLGLMGVPQPIAPGTVSTPDADATPMNRPRGLIRRNTTQAVDMERSARRLGDQTLLDPPQVGGSRRAPAQSVDRIRGVRRTVTEGALRYGVNGADDLARRHRTMNGVAAPLAGGNESPRSETTWGTVQTLSRDSISGGSMSSLGLLIGLHNGGGVRGQGSVTGESYVGREGLGDIVTSEEEADDETETSVGTGSLPGSESDVSSLGLIREDEGDYSGSRNHHVLEDTTSRHRRMSYSERTPHATEAPHERQPPRARRSEEGTNGQRRHASQSSIAEALHPDSDRVVNAADITSTNALSLHFDASFPTHDSFSAPSGPEIFAPTPIVGGPNIIHLWAGRA